MAKARRMVKKLVLGKDKKWLGVCSGFGSYFEIDPVAMRALWLVVTVMTGFLPGLIVYLLVAWVMPDK